MNSMPPIADLDLRRASLCQLLHWLAAGRVQPQALTDAYQTAIERLNPELPKDHMAPVLDALAEGESYVVEVTNMRADGTRFPVEVHSAAFDYDEHSVPLLWKPHRPVRPEKSEGGVKLVLKSDLAPKGDQPQAIKDLVEGARRNDRTQVLLGVTGSGKTFTMAKVIEETQRPALILAPNKTLAAQLYGEFKSFFPDNAVEYFVSYYDPLRLLSQGEQILGSSCYLRSPLHLARRR